jgi:hypothetical protein
VGLEGVVIVGKVWDFVGHSWTPLVGSVSFNPA